MSEPAYIKTREWADIGPNRATLDGNFDVPDLRHIIHRMDDSQIIWVVSLIRGVYSIRNKLFRGLPTFEQFKLRMEYVKDVVLPPNFEQDYFRPCVTALGRMVEREAKPWADNFVPHVSFRCHEPDLDGTFLFEGVQERFLEMI